MAPPEVAQPSQPARQPAPDWLPRTIGVVVVAFVFGYGATTFWGASAASARQGVGADEGRLEASMFSGSMAIHSEADPTPDDELTPAGVVQAQMQALVKCRLDEDSIERVFEFASPANKLMTGPLDRFEQMVWREPYVALIENRAWTVGRSVERDGAAAVLVTTIDDAGAARLFRFYLSQQDGALEGRWMTDGVFVLQTQPKLSPHTGPAPAEPVSAPRI